MCKSYENAVALLTSVGKFRISLGLERMEKILALLGNPQDKLDCIHVAGTNGKGSVCAILASILSASGKKTGLYTSPHIFKYTERIKIYGKTPTLTLPPGEGSLPDITDEDFARYVFEISNLSDMHKIDLTEFEILTAVMFKYFADKGVEIVVLETGLGGRFDATNVIKRNLCSIITQVDFDHTERLGDTLDKIIYEKAGIIKPNCPCISFTPLIKAIIPRFDNSIEFIKDFSLKGDYQRENLILALTALKEVFPNIDKQTIRTGLKNVKHPGRFQYIKEKNIIIDGAHNPNGMRALKDSLDLDFPDKPKRVIFGCLKNKDYKQMLHTLLISPSTSPLCPFKSREEEIPEVYFYHFNHQNSCDYPTLKSAVKFKSKELLPGNKIDFDDGKLTIICGSLYMIAELVKRFELSKFM